MQNPELAGQHRKLYRSKFQVKTWSTEVRKNILISMKNWILNNEDKISEALRKDFKKPAFETQATEIYPCITEINFFLKNLDEWCKPKWVPSGALLLGTINKIQMEAKGCVLIFGPWNYPFQLSVVPLIGAIAAGNTGILKPSELTPHTSQLIQEMVKECCRDDHFNVVLGTVETAKDLLKLEFDHIFFTGSPNVGKIVMKAAAENLTSVTLELGGKSSAIIDQSAQIPVLIKNMVFGKFLNNGQACVAIDTVFVHEDRYNEFVSEFKKMYLQMYPSGTEDLCEIINQKNRDRLSAYKKDHGGKLIPLGKEDDLACLIENPQFDSPVMQEEIFGPILPVYRFSTLDRLIELFHQQKSLHNPLALYIYSEDRNSQDQLLSQIPSGGVCINDCIVHLGNHHLPFGGHRSSGMGQYHGEYSFKTFSHLRAVLKRTLLFRLTHFLYAPYKGYRLKILRQLTRWGI